MCGIAGFVDSSSDPRQFHTTINRMLSAIRYRGPDEIGCRIDHRSALGSVRLSIIDLLTGQQPVASEDDRYWLCFNGEIFNYVELRNALIQIGRQFTTTSDTEVLLRALMEWGEDALTRLNGQFSFAFYDRRDHRLMMARDRMGERPLFYTQHNGAFIFGSEIKALFQHPAVEPKLDRAALGSVFHLWTNVPGETCFEGIRSLPPAHYLVWAHGKIEVKPYYRLPVMRPASSIKFSDAVAETKYRLEQSVRLRLRSDVPVSVYLSGGLDSTITTALAMKLGNSGCDSFSISFDVAEYDESKYQNESAQYFGTRHHDIRVSNRDIVEAFRAVVYHCETPLFRSAPTPMYLLARNVSANGLKVVLTGEGADEAFLGYDIFKETLFRLRVSAMDPEEARAAVARLYPYLDLDARGRESLLRFFMSQSGGTDQPLFSHRARFAVGQLAERLLAAPNEDSEKSLVEKIAAVYPGFAQGSPLERAQLLEYETLLAGYLLSSQGDRMTTAHGVEGRCPFLDHDVVDFAFSLPEEFKLREGQDEKHILKKAFGDMMPDSIARRAKQPYRAPDCRAFLDSLGDDWIADTLSRKTLEESGVFAADVVERFLARVTTLQASAITPREDQAFMLLLSTQLLHCQFLRDFERSELTPLENFSVYADHRLQ